MGTDMEFLKDKFTNLKMPRKSDLCYATTNRQEAILAILPKVESVVVVGSENSSNTNALVSMVQNKGVSANRVDNVNDLENINNSIIKTVENKTGAKIRS